MVPADGAHRRNPGAVTRLSISTPRWYSGVSYDERRLRRPIPSTSFEMSNWIDLTRMLAIQGLDRNERNFRQSAFVTQKEIGHPYVNRAVWAEGLQLRLGSSDYQHPGRRHLHWSHRWPGGHYSCHLLLFRLFVLNL